MFRTDREPLFLLLRAASRFESRLRRRENKLQRGYLMRNFVWLFQVIPFSIAIVAAVARKFFGVSETVAIVGLILLLLSYVATLIQPFLLAWVNRQALIAAVKNPMGLLLDNASVTARVDAWLLPRLLHSPIEHLELLHLELKAEKEFFERRLSLVVGAIEKVGLAPGLLAAGVSFSNLKTGQPDWVSALAYATPVLYVSGVAAHFLLMRLDRFAKLTELAVARKKDNLSVNRTFRMKLRQAGCLKR